MSPPLVRNGEVNITYSMLKADPAYEAVLAGLPQEMKDALCSKEKWIPLEIDISLHHFIYQVKGREEAIDWRYHLTMNSMKEHALRPLLEGTRRLLGLKPGHLFMLCPRVWNILYQNCGKTRIAERKKGYVRVEHLQIPRMMCEKNSLYVESFVGTYQAVIEICEAKGSAAILHYDPEEGNVVVEAKW